VDRKGVSWTMASRRTVNRTSGRVADAGGYNDETSTSGERLGGSFISTMAGGVVAGDSGGYATILFRPRGWPAARCNVSPDLPCVVST
jgi:hypothetical protein